MIKEAIKYLSELKKDPVVVINDKKYNVKLDNSMTPMSIVDRISEPLIEPIKTQTLTSLIDYLDKNPDNLDLSKLYIVIKDEHCVYLESTMLDDFKNKEVYLATNFNEPNKSLNEFISLENLLIMLNATFKFNEDLETIVKTLSKVTENNVKVTEDDGMSQTVTVKDGVELLKEKKLPRIVELIPYRTFPESEQPLSYFFLRVKKSSYDKDLSYGLFEADGGAWKNTCISNIKDYLEGQLDLKEINIPILA